ncbi:NADH dehydrogenase (ubiquinone) B17 subunit [Xylocopa sonorina]|uniref:NADH dehydrogenase (ubiquinone) B17 subunit n=1 Tax=Xylocopa sonorina TaxID=1818115 RepID=UPI00403A9FEF
MEQSPSSGTKIMSIGGRMVSERERLIGMTPEERAWRLRYLKSQELAPDEPYVVSREWYKANYNPIRRFYRFPLDCFQMLITPVLGRTTSRVIRYTISRVVMVTLLIYSGWYHLKYNTRNWEDRRGWFYRPTRNLSIPGTPNYTGLIKPKQWSTYGFENSPI